MRDRSMSQARAGAVLGLAILALISATTAVASEARLDAGSEAMMPAAGPGEAKDATEDWCGSLYCQPGQVCQYCYSAWHCVTEGWSCCNTTFCNPDQECVYCMGTYSCYPKGSSCCWPYICSPDQDCVYCMGAQRCYPKGSTCCYPYICTPEQKCEIGPGGSNRCVPR
jgi:hypothetical protein